MLVKGALGFVHRGLGLLELLDLDGAIDFALSQIADDRARLTGQTLGFALKRTNPIGNALGIARFLRQPDDGSQKEARQEQRRDGSLEWHSRC